MLYIKQHHELVEYRGFFRVEKALIRDADGQSLATVKTDKEVRDFLKNNSGGPFHLEAVDLGERLTMDDRFGSDHGDIEVGSIGYGQM